MDQKYLVPDYYPEFLCKMGACRSACCEGWPISVTMTDYFKLLGVECSTGLRRKLDCAMHLSAHPSPEAYAEISPRYDGQCPLRMEDGRCMLHTELGEGSLAAVCRLYPRGVRTEGVRECSCANSCEAVLELLLQKSEPLRFSYQELALEPSADEKEFLPDDDALKRESIRLWCIARIQDRRYSLPRRILWLGISLLLLEDAYKAQDIQRMQALMDNEEPILLPEPICPGEGPLTLGLEMANHMLQILDEKSSSIREYGESELAYFGTGEEECKKYMQACAQFADLLPQWEVWFEHILVNHMFFTQFPFQSQPVAMEEEFLGICSIYALVRFLAVGWAAQHHSVEDIVDVAAMAFRLIDHTDFDKIASHIIKKLGYDDRRHIWQMLHL